jgi:hypothetical protein
MRNLRCYQRLLGQWLLAAAIASTAGCLGFCHPLPKPEPGTVETCQSVPERCRSHVYVFLLNGADPLNKDNLSGLHDYLISLGFCKTYFGQCYHASWFNNEIRRIREEDPDARVVLLGFSCSANFARSMVCALQEDNIPIDLLIYLGGDTLHDTPEDQPENVGRLLNIRGQGCLWFGGRCEGEDLEQADNYYLADVSHSCLPTDRQTLEILTEELLALAGTVPIVERVEDSAPSIPPAQEMAPTPRPLKPQKITKRDHWDFLKPVTHLNSAPAAPAPAATRPASTMSADAPGTDGLWSITSAGPAGR